MTILPPIIPPLFMSRLTNSVSEFLYGVKYSVVPFVSLKAFFNKAESTSAILPSYALPPNALSIGHSRSTLHNLFFNCGCVSICATTLCNGRCLGGSPMMTVEMIAINAKYDNLKTL